MAPLSLLLLLGPDPFPGRNASSLELRKNEAGKMVEEGTSWAGEEKGGRQRSLNYLKEII